MEKRSALVQRLRNILVARRDELDLDQIDVAHRAAPLLGRESLTKQAVSDWENLKTLPGIDQFDAWALALDMVLQVDLRHADDGRVDVAVDRGMAETAHRLNDLSEGDREIVSRLVERLSRNETDSESSDA